MCVESSKQRVAKLFYLVIHVCEHTFSYSLSKNGPLLAVSGKITILQNGWGKHGTKYNICSETPNPNVAKYVVPANSHTSQMRRDWKFQESMELNWGFQRGGLRENLFHKGSYGYFLDLPYIFRKI